MLYCDGDRTRPRFGYRIAGRTVTSTLELPELAGFRTHESAPTAAPPPPAQDGPVRPIFSGPAFVGGRDRQVHCELEGQVAALALEDLGRYRLDLSAGAIRVLHPIPPAAAIVQALCGPCLPLVLAAGGVFVLHGSALATPAGIVALIGRSGSGKSTLAAELARRGGARAVADDALPVSIEGGEVRVPGTYPQLKWPAWGARVRHPPAGLVAVVELEPSEADVRAVALPPSEALLAAVSHTVAARLFGPELLARHLGFARELAARVPCWRLRYGLELRNLPAMVEWVHTLWAGSGR